MGEMKALLLEMEEYAIDTTMEEFLKKYPNNEDVWKYMNIGHTSEDPDEPCIPKEKSA